VSLEQSEPIRTAEIRAHGLGRSFDIRATPTRSIKEILLRKHVPEKHRLWALRDVDLAVSPGETFGVVGENGSGKSTLLKLLARIFEPSEGELEIGGRVGALLELGAGFHPDFTGVENVYLNAAIYGLKRSYVDEHIDEIIEFAELEEFAHMPVKTYSSGMFARLGFSVAVHVNPDVLLLDEVLAVGDEAFQQKCFSRILDFKLNGGTIVFVSHNPAAVEQLCDRAILLEHGQIVEEGTAHDVMRTYHSRLADRLGPPSGAATETYAPQLTATVRALGATGDVRERFVEGEPAVIEVELQSETPLRDGRLTITFRGQTGECIGGRSVDGLELWAERTTVARLSLPALPLREGRFVVEARLYDSTGAELPIGKPSAELAVFAHEAGEEGPVRLGGSWEVGTRDPTELAEAPEQ
jgi:ABC-type polysaccharide/polyol phosphate transport system ATPase subunit